MGKTVLRLLPVGMMRTNCYFVYDEDRKEVIIVDPGDSPGQIKSAVDQLGVKPIAILLTHAHFDHIGAMEKIKDTYQIPVYVGEEEVEVLANPRYNLGTIRYNLASDDVALKDNQVVELGGIKFKVLHTPGHTPGGCCYYIEEADILIAGDTMFRFSWGRTDFPGGSETALMRSIRERLLPLPPQTMVYPGHEGATQIKDEREMHGFTE